MVLMTSAALVTTMTVAACSSGGSSGSGSGTGLPGTITIAGLTSLTGASAGPCAPEADGMNLAVKQANAQHVLGSSTIKINVVDDTSTAEGAVTGFQKIVDSDAAGLVGLCNSNVAEAVDPQIDSDKLPVVITTAAATDLVKPQYAFRGEIPQPEYAKGTVDELASRGVKSVGVILNDDNPTIVELWKTVFVPELQAKGITVSYVGDVSKDATDYTAQIARIKQASPGAIGNLQPGANVLPTQQQIRSSGLNQPVFGQLSMADSAFLSAPAAAGSLFATNYAPVFPYASSKSFTAAFKAAYGHTPTSAAAGAFDATWRLIHAIATAKSTDRQTVRDALAAQKSANGAQGPLTFTTDGDVTGPGGIVQVAAGGVLTVVGK
jgi:ABC-type branched-subunit amino acid transport system substrate-binding protein